LPYHFILILVNYLLSPVSGESVSQYMTVHFPLYDVWAVNQNPVRKQHEERQDFKIYGIQCVENFISLTCFICDEKENKTYRKAIKTETQTGIYSGILEIIYCI
jgi:hypothetical protein